jgi:hypothetical protein
MFFRHPRRWLAPYAEGLLRPAQASAVASHVLRCQGCHRALDLVRAGQTLATRLAPARSAPPTWSELAPLLDAPPPRSVAPFRWALAAAAAVAIAAGGLAWRGPARVEASASAPLAALALETHRKGLDLPAGDPRLAEWLADLPLPAPDDDEDNRRTLEGASRLAEGAFAIGYRLGGEKVTLLLGRASSATARKLVSRRTEGDLQVASWTMGGRSYALVSRLRGDTACTVCHATSGPAALL